MSSTTTTETKTMNVITRDTRSIIFVAIDNFILIEDRGIDNHPTPPRYNLHKL